MLDDIRPYRYHLWMIGLAGFAIYLKSLFFGLSSLDDTALIADRISYLKNPSIFIQAFFQDVFYPVKNSFLLYRPMLVISLAIDTILWSGGLFFYHLTNIAIHIASSLLLYLFFIRLGYEKRVSFFFGLLFAVHPAIAQSVAWIPGRNDSLLALFLLSAMLSMKRYALHMLFFACALFTKESGIALPLVCLYYIYALAPDDFTRSDKKALMAGWALIIVLWGSFRYAAALAAAPAGPAYITRSMIYAIPSLIYYIGHAVLPFTLSVIASFEDMSLVYGYISIALIALALVFSRSRRNKYCLFGAAWFVLFLLPQLLYINSYKVISNLPGHRLYVPIIGLFIILMETDLLKAADARKNLSKIAGTAVIVILGLATFFYIGRFRDRFAFWEDAVRAAPHSASAHRILGEIYYAEDMVEMARQQFESALALDPAEPMVHCRLGALYARQNRLDEAERELKKEIAVNKDYALPYINLGVIYYKRGDTSAARRVWGKALLLEPENSRVKKYLDLCYVFTG